MSTIGETFTTPFRATCFSRIVRTVIGYMNCNGIAQPLPRPLPRTGANGIHRLTLVVKG